jgi:nicotinate phosphoribosyltransferase
VFRAVNTAAPQLPSSALFTDQYELTMLEGALRSGTAGMRAIFEVHARRLPNGRRYGVVAGTGRLLEALERFRFGPSELEHLTAAKIVDKATCEWLSTYRFRGDIDGYAEGDVYFPGSPILTVDGTFGDAVLLETLALSILNHDSAVASAASRMVCAAGQRPLIEMGSRRTHEEAAVAAARATYIAGFAATSNLAAGRRFGIPTTGTSAHAFTMIHPDERSAFTAQVAALGRDTTLLVDTYDVPTGVRTAVEVAGPELGAIRLDSGDLLLQARQTRALLDELGARDTKIVVTSDLDEYAIAALAAAPVDSYGVGTSVVTGSGAPTAGFVYKLVARATAPHPDAPMRPVAKASAGKIGRGGRKWALRRYDAAGRAVEEVLHSAPPRPGPDERAVQTPLVQAGELACPPSIDAARAHHRRVFTELPPSAHQLSRGEPALATVYAEEDGR